MCIQDVALGLKISSNVVSFTVGTTAASILGVNSKRRSIVFLPPLAGTLTYSPNSIVVAGLGVNVTAGGSPIELSRDDIGQIIAESWFAIADAADRVGAVIESTLPEEIYDAAKRLKIG